MQELMGCIGPGDRLGCVHNEWAVMNSRSTMNTLRGIIMPDDTIEIVWAHNGGREAYTSMGD